MTGSKSRQKADSTSLPSGRTLWRNPTVSARETRDPQHEARAEAGRSARQTAITRKKNYGAWLQEIFTAATHTNRPAPVLRLNELLRAASAVHTGRNSLTPDVPLLSDGMTVVLSDPKFAGRALVISYDAATIDKLGDAMELLNPNHLHTSPHAPTLERIFDLYAADRVGRLKPSGRMMAVRNFAHIDAARPLANNPIPCSLRQIYGEVLEALTKLPNADTAVTAPPKPGARAKGLRVA